jgi:hypothetical protein
LAKRGYDFLIEVVNRKRVGHFWVTTEDAEIKTNSESPQRTQRTQRRIQAREKKLSRLGCSLCPLQLDPKVNAAVPTLF